MSADRRTLRSALDRLGPLAVGIVVAAVGFTWFVRPGLSACLRARADVVSVTARVRALENMLARAGAQAPVDDRQLMTEFDKAVPSEDRVPDVIELLARNALDSAPGTRIQGLLIEAGERVVAGQAASPNAPFVAVSASDQPDPRVGLFAPSIEYTPVSVSFESTFDAIGAFLWRLRDLPATVEIRSMQLTRGLPLMRIEVRGYVYRRGRSLAPATPAGSGGGGQPPPRVAMIAGDLTTETPGGTGR